MALTPGTRLGPYEILSALGAGGMGEVYRAKDTKLGRDVALKILPDTFTHDPERLARFRREAQLLASLNHPHIGAIYGLDETNGQQFLVLELVDGESLDRRIARGPIPLHEALAIAKQIAEALEAAHERGIIHRDLKPANVALTKDGIVKVLDFGLAKATEEVNSGPPDPMNSPTITSPAMMTGMGVILGTAAYMSPEQARGRVLDKRADIWSFGCVLYQMLSGRRAFHGQTHSDLIVAILDRDPDLTRLPAPTPAGIRRLLQRCFEKDVRRRVRDIADARFEIEDALSPSSITAFRRSGDTVSHTWMTASPWLTAVAAMAVALLGAAAGRFTARQRAETPPPIFDRVVRLVSTAANEFAPAISPDGKWVAYLSNARGPTDVWVKFIAGGDPANLTANAGIDVQSTDYISGLEVSPDGTEIAVTVVGSGQDAASWTIPAPIGGVPRRVLRAGDSGLHWSPDGKRIAFTRTGGSLGDALVVADADGQNEQIVAKREGAQHIHWSRWSSDGRFVYFNHGPQNFNIEPTAIFRVAAAGGPIEPVVPTARRAAFPFLSRDGVGLVYAANPDGVDLNLWWRDLKTGRETRLTSGVGEYAHPSLSADGHRLVGTVIDSRQSLERVAVRFDRPVTLEPVTDGYSGDIDPVWSPDGSRLVFGSSRSGNRTLWSARAGLQQPAPLTSGVAIDERPAYSPNGRQIAFVSDRGGHRGIWIVSAEGGTPRFIASAEVIDTISWSPDGQRLVYSTPVGDAPGLMIMTVADGKIARLATPAAATGPAWSRDDVIAFVEPRGGTRGAYPQLIRPDGQRVQAYPLDGPEAPVVANGFIGWSADGKRLAEVALPGAGLGSIWIVDPNNRAPYKRLMDLPAGVFLSGLTWARDGSSLIVGRYRSSGDIFMAERSAKR